MSLAINNVAATAAYSQPLEYPGTRRIRITVANAAIYLQEGVAELPGGPPRFLDEPAMLIPIVASFDANCDAVRFKWVVAPTGPSDTPRVSIALRTEGEL